MKGMKLLGSTGLAIALSQTAVFAQTSATEKGAGIIHTPGSDAEIESISEEVGFGRDWRPHEREIALNIFRQTTPRIGRADDIASAVCFLASPRADFITGVNLVIDGGM